MESKKMESGEAAEMNARAQVAVFRLVKNMGGNPQGDVVLALDDGSMVCLQQPLVDLVARVNREGLEQGRKQLH